MVDEKNNKIEEKVFISYLDDDSKKKDQWVIILEENNFGVKFKFANNNQVIFIPWNRVLKIKTKEEKE